MDRFERGFAEWVFRYRLWLIIGCIAIVIGAMSHGKEVNPTTNYRVFFGKENPQLLAFEELEKTYSKNDNVLFVLTPKSGNVYTRKTLAAIHWLSNEASDNQGTAWKIPYSMRVDSITNFRHTEAKGDDLRTYALVTDPNKLKDSDLKRIRKIVESEPTLIGRVVSKDGRVAGVNVTISLPGKDAKRETPDVVNYSRKLAKQLEAKFPDIKVRIVGMVPFNNAFTEASLYDVKHLYPVALGLIILFLLMLLRSIAASLLTIVVMLMSIITAIGVAIWIDTPFTPPIMSSPIVILTVAIANSVHILVTFVYNLRQGNDKIDSLKESLRINIVPVFLTSFTTILGFLSMNFSEVPPFRHMGNTVAVGVAASFVFAVTFLPAVMSYLPIKPKKKKQHSTVLMEKFSGFVVNRRRSLLWSMALGIGVIISFVPRNELNDEFLTFFDHRIEIRRDMDYTLANLTGLYQIEYSVDSGKKGGMKDPAFLRDTEKLVNWFRQQKEVLHAYTFLDTIKRIHKSLNNDDPKQYRIPETRRKVAEAILLYENGVPAGFDPGNQVDISRTATRVTLNTEALSTKDMLAFERRVQKWIKANTTTIKKADGSGPTMMFAHISMRNIISLLTGTTIALFLISFVLIIAFRSVKIGLITMIPNLVPGAMGFGIWAIFNGQVGLALSVVTGMTLGIVVDDTVHFLNKYLRARREQGYSAEDSVRYAFRTVGYALVTTSTVLVVGFLVMSYSSFKLNADMGLLTAIVIVMALIADFLFLPALLMWLDKKRGRNTGAGTAKTGEPDNPVNINNTVNNPG